MLFEKVAEAIIRLSQKTSFGGVGGYSHAALSRQGVTSAFPQAEREASQFDTFFRLFETPGLANDFAGKMVLDLGSGYGGKTVEYVRTCRAREAHGIEPFENMVTFSEAYARKVGVTNCHFRICAHTEIPYDDCFFDAVVSHDVLEHVADPRATMGEIHRVLKPGGRAYIVFPPYHGLSSHHLDYITTIPGLHLLFPPETLIAAVNAILSSSQGERFGTFVQPAPRWSHNGKRKCLPSLNGLTGTEFRDLLGRFNVLFLSQKPHLSGRRKRLAWAWLFLAFKTAAGFGGLLRDISCSSVACILEKPVRSGARKIG
jgi:SAM-dependent methyltransferase